MKNTHKKNYREILIIDTTAQRYLVEWADILRSMVPKTGNLYRTTFSGLLIKVLNVSANYYLQKYTKSPTASKQQYSKKLTK